MKKILFLVMVVTEALLISGSALGDQVPYRIAVVPWAGWSPVHVAEAKGFWRELGVDVEVVTMESNIQMAEALMAGEVTIQFDMLGTGIGRYEEGKPIVIIAETDWSHGGDKIIVKKDLHLNAYKGKTVGVYLNEPSLRFFLNFFLSAQGMQVADFQLWEAPPETLVGKFIENDLQMILAYDPLAAVAVERGAGTVVATSADYPGSVPEGMLMLHATYQKTSKEGLKNIIRGWANAVVWSVNPANWQEYQQILNERTFAGDDPYSEDELKMMLSEVRIHSPQQMFERNKTGGATGAFIEELRTFLKTNGELKRNYSVADVFDNRIVEKALKN